MAKVRSKRPRTVPGPDDWAGYEADMDVTYAHRLMFGKTVAEVIEHFAGARSIERSSELLYMPRRAFQYYVLAFVDYLASDEAREDSDGASTFLGLLLNREEKDPGSVAQIWESLAPTVEFVATHRTYFDADTNIYGDFPERAEKIREKVRAAGVRLT
jgi:hypothetical protein